MNACQIRWLKGLLLVNFLACSSDGPDHLSDRAAAAVLQEAWKSSNVFIDLGEIQFCGGNVFAPGEVPMNLQPMYRTLASRGFLEITEERVILPGTGSRFSSAHSGVRRVATVTVTPEGTKQGTVHTTEAGGRRYVLFKVGETRIDDIVANERIDVNGEHYRVVLGTATFEFRQVFKDVPFREAWVARGLPYYPERRFRVLLKYDPFASKWQQEALDMGPRTADFRSHNVTATLGRLKSGS